MAFYLLILTLVTSCGKQKFPDYEEQEKEQEELPRGLYRAKFKPLNTHLARPVRAKTTLWTKDIQFYVRVGLNNGPPLVQFRQYIHKGSRCPELRYDDLNRDNTIDYSEVLISSGERLIPLDGNLSSQSEGKDLFPVSNKRGKYYYSRAAAIFYLLEDLRDMNDSTLDAGLAKLDSSEDLDIGNRTIIIYGSEKDPLLPIACAEIKKVYQQD